jgi:hypothetical protein
MIGPTLLALDACLSNAARVATDELVQFAAPEDRAKIEAGVKAELWLAVEDFAAKARRDCHGVE